MKDFSDTQPAGLYEAAIGVKNQLYYLDKFEIFDKKGPGLHVSWNWAAFIGGGAWALYRKMYGWFFAWWAVATLITVFAKVPNTQLHQLLLVVLAGVWLGFSAFANALYHTKVKARIASAQKTSSDASRVSRRLSAGAGVHMWVPIGLGGIVVLGILAAVVLPAYQDYKKPQTVAENPERHDETKQVGKPELVPFTGVLDGYQDAVRALEKRDYALALNILRPLATQGNAEAQWALAWMYNNGQGVAQNYSDAVKLFTLAAEQGHLGAQSGLGMAYADGLGVPRNLTKALMWETLGAVSGNPFAESARDGLSQSMTQQQVTQAQQMARDCQQRNFRGC